MTYKPTGYYYREALRATDDPEELRALGMAAMLELELLRSWVYEQGERPPHFTLLHSEAHDKCMS